MIGVNAQIASESGGNDGVGFAIGIDTVEEVAGALADGEDVSHAYLGVSLADGDESSQVSAVSTGGPAASAGLQAGDEIVSIEGRSVGSADELRAAIDDREPGEKVTLGILRNGARRELDVTLGTRPA